MELHIIYTKSDMILSKKEYGSWREIQDEYEFYMASLGPWNEEDIIEYLDFEYLDLSPDAAIQVRSLISGNTLSSLLSFQSRGRYRK